MQLVTSRNLMPRFGDPWGAQAADFIAADPAQRETAMATASSLEETADSARLVRGLLGGLIVGVAFGLIAVLAVAPAAGF